MEDLDNLMREYPGGSNHGRRANRLLPSEDDRLDGQAWPSETRDLSLDEELDFYRTEAEPYSAFGSKRASEHGLNAHRGLLSPDELLFLDIEETKSRLEQELGLRPGDLNRAYGTAGTIRPAIRELRYAVDITLLEAVEKGASTHWLARALGWRIRVREGHSNDCPRMSRTLSRARKLRKEIYE